MNILDFGFDKLSDDLTARVENLLDKMSEDQRAAMRRLSEHRQAYYEDAKWFMKAVLVDELTNKANSVAQRRVNVTLAATHIVLRATTQFMLCFGEIIQFGDIQGDLPSMETERILTL